MKLGSRKSIATIATAGLALAAPLVVKAQSSVTLYGLIDSTIRYSTNQNAAGNRKVQFTDGILTGSRWGLTGKEDIGGGVKVTFTLENGFLPGTGAMTQGLEFGRRSTVGMESRFGTVDVGRQFDLAHDVIASYDAMAIANAPIQGYQGSYVGGNRTDNTIRYTLPVQDWSLGLQYTFGNVAGSLNTSSSKGAALTYTHGAFSAGGVYQVFNDVTSTYFRLTTPNSQQRTWSLGASYVIGPAKLFFAYINSQLDTADYRNNVYDAGIRYSITPSIQFVGITFYDRLHHAGKSGNRFTVSPLLDYLLSKRTDVYVAADFSKLSGAWITLASQPNFSTPFYGRSSMVQGTVGLRHRF